MLQCFWPGCVFLAAVLSTPAAADRLEPFPLAVFQDPLGHFTVTVPAGAMPCIRTADKYYGGRKTLMLFFGRHNPCPQALDFTPTTPASRSWHPRTEDYTIIEITATANRRLNRSELAEWEWTPRKVAEVACMRGAGNMDDDIDSPFTFAGLAGAACVGGDLGWSYWDGRFHRPWINTNEADRDSRGRILPWIEYRVELYGPDDGFKRYYPTLEQIFKSITLIPASPDAARHW